MNLCVLGNARSVHLQRLVRGFADRGLNVHVVTRQPADLPGATVERFTVPRPSLGNLRGWRARWRRQLCQLLRRFDVVNVQFLSVADWGFTPEIMKQGVVVASPWGSDIVAQPGHEPPASLRKSRIELLRHACGITAWGPTFAGQVAAFADIDVNTIDLLPLGVDTDLFRPMRGWGGLCGEPCRVGFLKGFRAVYGAECLVRAIPLILDRVPDVRFELIGDGPTLKQCRELGTTLGVDAAIEWLPWEDHADVPRRIARWDVMAIPSLRESFGAVALESAAVGVPVVASRVGGLVDSVLDRKTGLLVEPESPAALADGIVALLQDDARRLRMASAGRERVKQLFDWNQILDDWVVMFQKARDRSEIRTMARAKVAEHV